MSQSYRITFVIAIVLVFLVPLFFIPGMILPIAVAKSLLLSLGVMALSLAYLYESFRQGTLNFPKHNLLWAAALLPAVYLLSALLSTPSSLSLMGYNLEVGTFGYALIGALALGVVASLTIETGRYLQVLITLLASLSLLVLFAVAKIFSGENVLAFGNFAGKMGNPLGMWTDLSVVSGMLASLAALTVGMVPMKGGAKMIVYSVFVLSGFVLVVTGFSTGFAVTLTASLFLWWYFAKVEKDFHFQAKGEKGSTSFFSRPIFLPIVLAIVSLFMFINPTVSETAGRLTNVVSAKFGIENSDVRPSLTATLSVSKAVLSEAGLLGSGPNTFGQDWLVFKPLAVNATPFWGVAFPFGAGFIPTQIATTGILGTALWVVFLGLLLALTLKILGKVPESRAVRFALVSTLCASLFLWIAVIFYTPSAALFFLAFILTGFLLSLARTNEIVGSNTVNLKGSTPTHTLTLALMVLAAAGVLYLGFLGGEKASASYHFQKAIKISNIEGSVPQNVENEILKAISIDPVDVYYTALSQLNFSKAQAAANSKDGTKEENQKVFEESIRKTIEASRAAVSVNSASYGNWVALGSTYTSLVAPPLKVEGAYEMAQSAFSQALRRNPNNPELPLFLARLEIAKGNADEARSYIRNSLALKEDYADAYILLAQLEVQEKNIPAAIASTEVLAKLAPENAGVHFELGVLKYENKDFEAATASLKESLRISPDYANAKYYLALTYVELGMRDEARAEVEALVGANPESAELKTLLEKINKIQSSR